ncbi:hypothetical protein DFH06DRAFT_1313610 [Mycena polygramma]|nr:hypothetical protein DFH06DRAFT_1313610 [Mycena polygramma]
MSSNSRHRRSDSVPSLCVWYTSLYVGGAPDVAAHTSEDYHLIASGESENPAHIYVWVRPTERKVLADRRKQMEHEAEVIRVAKEKINRANAAELARIAEEQEQARQAKMADLTADFNRLWWCLLTMVAILVAFVGCYGVGFPWDSVRLVAESGFKTTLFFDIFPRCFACFPYARPLELDPSSKTVVWSFGAALAPIDPAPAHQPLQLFRAPFQLVGVQLPLRYTKSTEWMHLPTFG